MANTEGLRARKKRLTRALLRDAAVNLFAERGYEGVTVAEVAERAGVSVATLFAYVPDGKEALVFEQGEDRVAAITATIAERADASVLDALELFILSRGPFRGSPRSVVDDLVAGTPALRNHARVRWVAAANTVADAIATDAGREPTAADRALATFALEVPDIAGQSTDPAATVKELFNRLRSGWSL